MCVCVFVCVCVCVCWGGGVAFAAYKQHCCLREDETDLRSFMCSVFPKLTFIDCICLRLIVYVYTCNTNEF